MALTVKLNNINNNHLNDNTYSLLFKYAKYYYDSLYIIKLRNGMITTR